MTHRAVVLAMLVAVQSVPILAGHLNAAVVPLTPANTIITFVAGATAETATAFSGKWVLSVAAGADVRKFDLDVTVAGDLCRTGRTTVVW